MITFRKPDTDTIVQLMRAIELLDVAGYSYWFLEEFAVENMFVFLDGIPTEIPLLPSEIELLASAHDEIMALAGWNDASDPIGPMLTKTTP